MVFGQGADVAIALIGPGLLDRSDVEPAGWASVIGTILFLGGIQTFCIGVIGEYVGRIYTRVNNAPQFVVGKTTFERPDAPVWKSRAADPGAEG